MRYGYETDSPDDFTNKLFVCVEPDLQVPWSLGTSLALEIRQILQRHGFHDIHCDIVQASVVRNNSGPSSTQSEHQSAGTSNPNNQRSCCSILFALLPCKGHWKHNQLRKLLLSMSPLLPQPIAPVDDPDVFAFTCVYVKLRKIGSDHGSFGSFLTCGHGVGESANGVCQSSITPDKYVEVLEEWIQQEASQLQTNEHDNPILETLQALVAHHRYLSQLPMPQRSLGNVLFGTQTGTVKLDGSNYQVLRDYAIVAFDNNHYGGHLLMNHVPIFDLDLKHITELARSGQVVDIQGNVTGSRDMVFLEHYVPFSILLNRFNASHGTIALDKLGCMRDRPDITQVGSARHEIPVFLRGAKSGSQPGLLNHALTYCEHEGGEFSQELTVIHHDQGKYNQDGMDHHGGFSRAGDSGSVVFGAWYTDNEECTAALTKAAIIGQLSTATAHTRPATLASSPPSKPSFRKSRPPATRWRASYLSRPT
ncbi:hypothetical protein PG996_010197 [Apiospora saccharicola]|uniref:Uncharacterized protein n=1 Tax=Apiospora saccharicola TaxID=335842 RepID=A0ABR1UMY6_9PEZI